MLWTNERSNSKLCHQHLRKGIRLLYLQYLP